MAECYLDILTETIRNNWDHPALTDFYLTEDGTAQDTSRGNHYTYGEMYAEIVRLADFLTHLGLRNGDHIAICGANSAHWVIAYLAIAKIQGVSVTIMHSLRTDEIARLIDFSDAKALFVDRDLWNELKEQSLSQVESVISLDDWYVLSGKQIKLNYQLTITNDQCQFVHGGPDELAMICFTSGSTGVSKGVMLPYRSISNNIGQTFTLYPVTQCKPFLSFLPYTHMAGLAGDALSQLVNGAHLHILRNYPTLMVINSSVLIISPYMFISVPEIFNTNGLNSKNDLLQSIQHSCKLIFIGGAKVNNVIENKITMSGIPLSIIYGQTETGASISISPYKKHRARSSGKIVSGMSCCISPAGEILVKGENVMLGYYKDPEATAQKIDKDGWLHTGDKGYLDEDGYLYVEGRLEHDIIVLPNGENIRPDNIESLINALLEVKESLVLARNGKLVAIVVPSSLPFMEESEVGSLRRSILRAINPQLPLFSQLYDVEITDQPLARTEKQTIKRYLYK